MTRRTEGGKRTISGSAMQPKDLQRGGSGDPVIGYAEDPEKVTDKKLLNLLCADGGLQVCPGCVH